MLGIGTPGPLYDECGPGNVPSEAECGGWASPDDAEDGTLSSPFAACDATLVSAHSGQVAGKRKAVFQPTPFAIAWTLAAVYGAVLLAVAVMIGIKLMRSRAAARGQDGLTVACRPVTPQPAARRPGSDPFG